MFPAIFLWLTTLGVTPEPAPDFETEVMPVLTRSGCNVGACHGAAAGRGGFQLSLLGADPAHDYHAIAHALEGRRVNFARAELSLLLSKPTGRLPHGGDVALEEGSEGEQRILRWIEAGAPRGAGRRLMHFEVTPTRVHLPLQPGEIPVRATAIFDEGPAEDVTKWTVFTSLDPEAIDVDRGREAIRVRSPGQHVIIARFLNQVVSIQVSVPLGQRPVDLAVEPSVNFIDEEISKSLSLLRLPPSPQVDDAAFLRRVRLDLTGRLPTRDEVDDFVRDSNPIKRAQLVDSLLSSRDFVDYWTLRMSRYLGIHGLAGETAGIEAYTGWLRREIEADTPMYDLARQLITATGDSHHVGPANFCRMVPDARTHAESFGRFFLGARLGCANCHNHPLDKWTQDDYHGLASVFARIERGRHVVVTSQGAVTNPRTGQAAVARIPGVRDLSEDEDQLAAVAEWLTDGRQKAFARVTVNRLWQAMFGRGLVEPTDDMRDTNPATHPELLERLATDFIDNGTSLRHTLRLIAVSRTYGRSDRTVPGNEVDNRFYSHAFQRPLMPEVLADAIADVTGVADTYEGLPEGARAVHLVDPLVRAPSLDSLGRCTRAAGCDSELSGVNTGVATQLHLINGELINGKLRSPEGRLRELIAAGRSDTEIVDEFYRRALSRKAEAAELDAWCQRLSNGPVSERSERLEDFVWALLNSHQFTQNH